MQSFHKCFYIYGNASGILCMNNEKQLLIFLTICEIVMLKTKSCYSATQDRLTSQVPMYLNRIIKDIHY